MACKALTAHTLPPEEICADLAQATQVDNAAIGRKALYLPGRLLARARYVPLEAIERAFLRVMVGERRHGGFQQPLLVLLVDGKEIVYLYRREQAVRGILAQLAQNGVTVGKPQAPKPN